MYYTPLQWKEKNTILVASIYMPIDSRLPPMPMEELLKYSEDTRIPVIVASDTNAHHHAWGSNDCNQRGYNLCEFIAATNLEISNVGCEPTFCSDGKKTVIDVTFASSSIASQLCDWCVETNDTMSDHRQINFFLKYDKPKPIRVRNRRNTNWSTYEEELQGKIGLWFGKVDNPADIERELTKISSAIITSFERACPEKRIRRKNRVPWWNRELKILRRRANHAFHRAYKTSTKEDWDKYKEARRAFKRTLRKSKRESWQDFCSNIETMHESARLHKLLGKTHVNKLGMLRLPHGGWTKSLEEANEHLMDVHFPGCCIDNTTKNVNASTTQPVNHRWIPSVNWNIASDIVTCERIKWAFDCMSPFKSPGEDGIFPALLQKGSTYLLNPIKCIYRAALALGYIPIAWRIARVAFIPKPGKIDYTTAKSFRPISLTSFLLKGLEKLVDRYLRDGPMVTLPIHPRQHAYQAGKSTESAITPTGW